MDLGKLVELSKRRVCGVCGKVYHSEGKESAMQRVVAHMIEHQAGPDQWTEAYERIRATTPKRQRGSSE